MRASRRHSIRNGLCSLHSQVAPAADHRDLTSWLVVPAFPLQAVFTMLLKKIYKRQK